MQNAAVPMTRPAPSRSNRVRHTTRSAAAVGVLCGIVYLLTAAYTSVSGDVTATDVLSWQVATTGDAEFTPSTYPPIDEHPGRSIWVLEANDGHEVIGRSPGAVVAALPAYWLGGDSFSLVPGAVAAALLTAAAVFVLALALLEQLPRREAVLATLAVALGTPVWSVAANGMWPHTVTVLGICAMAWAAGRERWWLVGVMGGVVLWGRLHAAVIVAVLGLLLGWQRRDARLTAKVAAGSLALLALQGLWTRGIYGSWNPMSSYDTRPFEDYAGVHAFDLVNQLGFWVAPDRGLLVWTPVVVLLLPALVRAWRGLPDWSRALALGGLAYTVLQGSLNRFSGGDTFYGYRLTLELVACAAPALALSARHVGVVGRTLLAPVLALQAFVISAGAVNERLGSPAEDVWRTHSFFAELVDQPVVLAGFLILCVAAGVLGRRIWSDPTIGRPDAADDAGVGSG